jgi:hypothetical protein
VLRGFVKMFEGLLEFFVTGPKLTAADQQHRVKATACATRCGGKTDGGRFSSHHHYLWSPLQRCATHRNTRDPCNDFNDISEYGKFY